MKVKDLIEELLKHDPEKEVLIQQGEEYDYQYLEALTVRDTPINIIDDDDEEAEIDGVVIDYM